MIKLKKKKKCLLGQYYVDQTALCWFVHLQCLLNILVHCDKKYLAFCWKKKLGPREKPSPPPHTHTQKIKWSVPKLKTVMEDCLEVQIRGTVKKFVDNLYSLQIIWRNSVKFTHMALMNL